MVDLISVDRLFLAFFLAVVNGVFVAAEFAFVKLRPTRVNTLVDRGKPGAELVRDAIENLDGYLAISQLGITLSSLGLGWIGEPAVAVLIEPILGELLPAGAIRFVAFTLGFGFITSLHIVFGELAPKAFATQEAERVVFLVAPLIKFFYYVLIPSIIVFNGTVNYFTSLFDVSPVAEGRETHSGGEILMILTCSEETGKIDLGKVEMIESIFELGGMIACEIMASHPGVKTVSASMTLPELRSVTTSGAYTRYTVLDEDGEQPIGFVHAEDILKASETEADRNGPIAAHDIICGVPVMPETRRIDTILAEFQTHGREQTAVVIDERGVSGGIVTTKDILEEIAGDIRGEFDTASQGFIIEERDDGTYVVDGGMPVRGVNEWLGVEFEVGEVETIGGFVSSRLGREPEITDEIEQNGYIPRVDFIGSTRIERFVIQSSERSQKQITKED